MCRAARTRKVAENNVRVVCERLKRIQTVGHRFCQDTDKILAGDREVEPLKFGNQCLSLENSETKITTSRSVCVVIVLCLF